jgi:1-aminocyclopropane-1-carboxylate deaminase/D-cysteine desulfhydrase-like pyridoxal-dependent ACC family enzyme
MQFHKSMTLKQRIVNLSKLTPKRELVEVMSDEYAKLYGKPYEEILEMMIAETESFRNRFYRKKRIKKRLLFWK